MHAPDLEFYLYFFHMKSRGWASIVSHKTRHSSTRLGNTLEPTCEVPEGRLESNISGWIMWFSTSVRLPFNKGYVNLPASHCCGSLASAVQGGGGGSLVSLASASSSYYSPFALFTVVNNERNKTP